MTSLPQANTVISINLALQFTMGCDQSRAARRDLGLLPGKPSQGSCCRELFTNLPSLVHGIAPAYDGVVPVDSIDGLSLPGDG